MSMPPIPQFYQKIKQILVTPSHSAAHALKTCFRDSANIHIKSASLFADALKPEVVSGKNTETLLLHSFIGATPILYLIELLEKYSLERIFFVGSCSRLSTEHYITEKPSVIFPDLFFNIGNILSIHNLNHPATVIKTENNEWSEKLLVKIASHSMPTFIDSEFVQHFYAHYGVTYFDMESAFIADICAKKGIKYFAALVPTDETLVESDTRPRVKKISQVPGFNMLFDKLLKFL